MQELDDVLGGEPVSADHIPRLEYLDAVVYEGLRCPPASPFAGVRIVQKPTEIGGFEIAPGTVVTQGFGVMSQRQDVFETPGKFNPDEHFHQRRIKPYTFSPFGGGKRMCIGKAFAQLELKVTLATIFTQANVRPDFDRLRGVREGFLVQPENGGLVTFLGRRDS